MPASLKAEMEEIAKEIIEGTTDTGWK